MLLIDGYIQQKVENPIYSDLRYAQGVVAGGTVTFNQTFRNMNVVLIVATFLYITPLVVSPAAAQLIDDINPGFRVLYDFPGGVPFASFVPLGFFFYMWEGERICLRMTNTDYQFNVGYQLIYTALEPSGPKK